MAIPPVFGHRGFKAQFPENTLTGFSECFKTGAKGIETDVWLTKDGVAIVSHDPNTKRVFCHRDGLEADYDILDTEFYKLEPLVDINLKEPLFLFKQLCEYFVNNQVPDQHQKIMLDIKVANPPRILDLLFQDMYLVRPDWEWWSKHLQLGFWHLDFVKYLNQADYFQDIPKTVQWEVVHISFSWTTLVPFVNYNAWLRENQTLRRVFPVTAVLLIYLSTWTPLFVQNFLPVIKANSLDLFSWTINYQHQVDYLRHVLDAAGVPWGIVTDHPDKGLGWVQSKGPSWELGYAQKLLAYGFDYFFQKPVKVDNFVAKVDPTRGQTLKRSKLGMKIFQWLQHKGWC